MSEKIDQRWAQFEQLGETKVRQNLAEHVYGEDNTRFATAWLAHKAQERASLEAGRIADSQSIQALAASRAAEAALRAADAAERSAEAAERQATTAERATRTAIAALIVAIIAAILSLIAMVRGP